VLLGVQAIGDAARIIRSGEADIAICGGTEAAIDRVTLGCFAAARALSTGFAEHPQAASRPICYTSGTTGHPNGAVLSHQAILVNVAMTATMHGRNPADVVVSALPLSHVYGNVVMNAAMAYGMTLVLHATFDAKSVLESIQDHRATIFEGVPTMYMYLLDFADLPSYDLSSLQRCTVGGQTMPEVTMQKVEAAFGCRLLELWGMTELGGLGATHSLYGQRRLGSIGIPLPHVLARTVDPDDQHRVLSDGSVGELQIKGPITMMGYLGRAEATQEVLASDGWLRTGDLARIDSDGFIYVVDRLKDMIITAGFNIYPAELERVLAEHPAVAMVAVAGIPDATKGELAKAYIVPRAGFSIDLAEVEHHCRSRLAAYKVPRLFQLVDHLPKTSSGKVMRRLLRSTFEGVGGAGSIPGCSIQ
jgi:long-chain acyl-CoA synthetase